MGVAASKQASKDRGLEQRGGGVRENKERTKERCKETGKREEIEGSSSGNERSRDLGVTLCLISRATRTEDVVV